MELIEDRPELRLLRDELEDITTAHETDRDVVTEVEGARILGRDPPGLEARFGEDEELRFHRDIQCLEYRAEIAGDRLGFERHLAVSQPFVQLEDRVRLG